MDCIRISGRLLFGRSYWAIRLRVSAFRKRLFLSWRREFLYCSLQAAKTCYWSLQQILAASRLVLSGFELRANFSLEIFAPAHDSVKQAISFLL